ncbi:hypothetical protein GCM10010222_57150 [Streptomyces tanashiensis]|nr:hypothetical protein GCM10010222_57150 [Streptomyces tanashiensis]
MATHFTHQGIPARISCTAIVPTSLSKNRPARCAPNTLKARGGRKPVGVPRPPLSPDPPPRGSGSSDPQPSGGEKTTMTRRSSLMWWNLCSTPAGT